MHICVCAIYTVCICVTISTYIYIYIDSYNKMSTNSGLHLELCSHKLPDSTLPSHRSAALKGVCLFNACPDRTGPVLC